MLCQRCQQRPATVHFTQVIGGDKTEYHLCDQCAQEKGDLLSKAAQAFSFNSWNPFQFNQLLSGLLNMESSPGFASPPLTQLRCDHCGLPYSQFTKTGRFGCAHCYDSFEARLEPMLRRIQSNTTHTGKVPLRAGGQVKVKKELQRLRRELQQAVSLEQFEHAARLRDEIRRLEQQLED
ncbi:UvrB/UvrC motif-containing protein [Alicyclobacillus macrosporangiidus]|uniref:UvrB/UvrC motif-containing protein n=1 Tax=Alicyclobacillus macrosporangiidus TaxID=392015 RepID=UPI0004956B34|nr:UvrB/UvrC motif-containing protein [Alicyclobacillus macrosporangiidus]MCL6600509.1 UvrB/UvrC motif-containing protein [Alicyclobacillus macrosporangiidus]